MSKFSLYDRLRRFGTIADSAKDIPDALYALPSTINWMRALAILTRNLKLDFKSAKSAYSNVQVRKRSDKELNTAFEQLLFALNQIASLRVMATATNKADVARMGIVAWYYAIYGSASAMIAAADGTFQQTHAKTANQWDQIFAKKIALPPFSDRLTSLLKQTVKSELAPMRLRGKHSLTSVPTNSNEAWGCIAEYMSGCASWEQWNIEQRVRKQQAFKSLGVNDFRTKSAQNLRDNAYRQVSLSFLHQAFRYRGKANYRDAIFLAYGKGVPTLLTGLIDDLAEVATSFSAMAAAYVSARIGNTHWNVFIADLEAKRSVSLSPKTLWS